MKQPAAPTLYYKRSRFTTRLPTDRHYTASHYWLLEEESSLWRVGLTKFALRMMGDLVEYSVVVSGNERIEIGQVIGTVEGLKAVSDLYGIVQGKFLRSNPDLDRDITLVDHDPYGRGWLYQARGEPEPQNFDVQGYVSVLDAIIDRMLRERHEGAGDSAEG